MLREALRPASLALLALALAVATGCALLGQWQLERSRAPSEAAGGSQLEQPVPLTEVLDPGTTFTGRADGQVVTATGEFDASRELLVDGRLLDGRSGRWVLTPLVTDPATGPGSGQGRAVLPVVRGWVPAGTDAGQVPPPPSGPVDVAGQLIAGEPPRGVTTGEDGAPTVTAVSPADLVNLWEPPLYTGFVIATEPSPQPPLQAVPSRAPSSGTDWRNVSYALQWWLFSGFAVVVWWRLVRNRYLAVQAGPAEGPEADDEAGAEDAGGAWEDGAATPPAPAHGEQEPQEAR